MYRDETGGRDANTSADALRDQLLARIDVIGSILEVDYTLQSMQGDIEAVLEDMKVRDCVRGGGVADVAAAQATRASEKSFDEKATAESVICASLAQVGAARRRLVPLTSIGRRLRDARA